MTADARLCLQKTWPLIERLVIEISLLVSLIKPLPQREHLRVLRMVRLAEGLLRRWLVLRACARPLKAPARGTGRFVGMYVGAGQGLGRPVFRLADPAPRSRAAPGTNVPADPPVPVQGAPVCLPADCPMSFPMPLPTPTPAAVRLWTRSQALLGAVRAPDKQIARMRRFLARGLSGLGPFPLRLERPWCQSTKEKRARPDAYAALRDLRLFTRDALIEQLAPG